MGDSAKLGLRSGDREKIVGTTTAAVLHTTLNAADRAVLDVVESTLAQGVALKRWWERKQATDGYAERFDVVRTFNPSSTSFGFNDVADLPGVSIPVNGILDDMLYDNRKHSSVGRSVEEFREFVLHYFLRVSDFRQPGAHIARRTYTPPDLLRNFSWCPKRQSDLGGFGFSQLYYKLRKTGEIGKFPASRQYRIADLRDIGDIYDWLVLKVQIYNFDLTFNLPGTFNITLNVPLQEETYLVISKDFVVNEDRPASGVLGRYGFGYVFLKNPTRVGAFAFGPGEFAAAFELIRFSVLENGETRVASAFVENRPDRIMNVSVDPFGLSLRLADCFSFGLASTFLGPVKSLLDRAPFRLAGLDPVSLYISLANALTNGEAAEDLCLSKEFLAKTFLLQHYMQHYQMFTGSLLTWRRVSNWLDRSSVPLWVIEGRERPKA